MTSALLGSLPGVAEEDDDGVTETLRRSKEMDDDPSGCLSHDQFLRTLGRDR